MGGATGSFLPAVDEGVCAPGRRPSPVSMREVAGFFGREVFAGRAVGVACPDRPTLTALRAGTPCFGVAARGFANAEFGRATVGPARAEGILDPGLEGLPI